MDAIHGSVKEWERTCECPDHCASVAERWRLAAYRFAEGWAEYKHKCSRCGTNLMACPEFQLRMLFGAQPEHPSMHYWCPGCGKLPEKGESHAR
jgi:hypothetical protein